jgi:L-2,4-diaminobutyric acid acetyltransferase
MVNIRGAEVADLPAIMRLARSSPFLECHTEHTYWILLRYGGRYVFVAEDDDGDTVGYVSGVRSTRDPACMFVWQLIVQPRYRRDRLAYDLLVTLSELAAKDGCTTFNAAVARDNRPVLALIERWAADTGRILGRAEEITYQAGYPGEEETTVQEDIIVATSPT